MKFHEEGNFDFCRDTTTQISAKLSCVSNGKAVRRFDLDFELFPIDFCHSFDFAETNCVSIIHSMLFFVVKVDDTNLFLRNTRNMDGFSFFTGSIENFVSLTKVNESVAIES